MCSIVILRQPGATFPLIIGGNRDEMAGRPWKPPSRHWPDRPDVLGGIDELAGGSWLALNDTGVVAVVLNRMGTLGPEQGKRSRGELVLDALDHADAADAAQALAHLDPAAYRPFNLVVADNRDAFCLSRREDGARIGIERIPEGVSMVTAQDLNDDSSSRIRFYRPLFAHARTPDPAGGDWKAWEELLGSRIWDGDAGPRGAMCVVTPTGFGTTSSTLLALPSADHPEVKPVFRFCSGRPDETPWEEVDLS
ncbi:NRDE family protein [Skermanella pratensis]|uniref:NRDE family protein n=1 Tax=Skermanella pratensis TaxID=2233999 RepID=UPI001300D5B1|nr:NRDE family protein [Skermanella pratensis]